VNRALLAALFATSALAAGCVDLGLPLERAGGDAGPDSQSFVDAGLPNRPEVPSLAFSFDTDDQGWRLVLDSEGKGYPEPEWTQQRTLSPGGALRVPLKLTSRGEQIFVGILGETEEIGLRDTVSRITFNLWLPPNHKISWSQAFVFGFNAPDRWQSINSFQFPLRAGDWTTFVLEFENGYQVAPGLTTIGLELKASAPMDADVFIDDVVVEFVTR